MRRLHPNKLLLSKCTAASPHNREKHFLVNELLCDEAGTVLQVDLQALLTRRSAPIDWRQLQDDATWLSAWQ